jgi:hypothetical protein
MCHNTLFVNANLAHETLYIRKHLGGSQPLDSGIYQMTWIIALTITEVSG